MGDHLPYRLAAGMDCRSIHLDRADERRFWTSELAVSEQELSELVRRVGPDIDDIVRALRLA
ncbi:MAG: DUF3606 domain-containing protein [Myxococcota bacterium]